MPPALRTWFKERAPAWLTTAVFGVGRRLSPSLSRRSSLTMCRDVVGNGAHGLPDGYSMTRLRSPTAPAGWIETLRSAGLHVTAETWTADLGPDRPSAVLAIVHDTAIVGTASVTRIGDATSRFGLITWVAIRPEHQGRKLGLPLVEACVSDAGRLGLSTVLLLTDDHRLAAIRTYASAGFRICANAWDWTHRPRWRAIQRALRVEIRECGDVTHRVPIARLTGG